MQQLKLALAKFRKISPKTFIQCVQTSHPEYRHIFHFKNEVAAHPSWNDIRIFSVRLAKQSDYNSISAIFAENIINYCIRYPRFHAPSYDWLNIRHCELCWRFCPGVNGRYFCSQHRPRAESGGQVRAEYKSALRRKDRFLERVQEIQQNPKRFPPSFDDMSSWLLEIFPLTYAALGSPSSISPKYILETLDENDKKKQREKFHKTLISDPIQIISFICHHEAYYSTPRSSKWGGKREGAGRRKNNQTELI